MSTDDRFTPESINLATDVLLRHLLIALTDAGIIDGVKVYENAGHEIELNLEQTTDEAKRALLANAGYYLLRHAAELDADD